MSETRDDLELVIEPGRIVLSRPSGRLLPEDIWRAEAFKQLIDGMRHKNGGSDE